MVEHGEHVHYSKPVDGVDCGVSYQATLTRSLDQLSGAQAIHAVGYAVVSEHRPKLLLDAAKCSISLLNSPPSAPPFVVVAVAASTTRCAACHHSASNPAGPTLTLLIGAVSSSASGARSATTTATTVHGQASERTSDAMNSKLLTLRVFHPATGQEATPGGSGPVRRLVFLAHGIGGPPPMVLGGPRQGRLCLRMCLSGMAGRASSPVPADGSLDFSLSRTIGMSTASTSRSTSLSCSSRTSTTSGTTCSGSE